VEDVG
jgi:hypothetical protein